MLNVDGWTEGRTDKRTDERTNGRKLARLCLPAKAGATIIHNPCTCCVSKFSLPSRILTPLVVGVFAVETLFAIKMNYVFLNT